MEEELYYYEVIECKTKINTLLYKKFKSGQTLGVLVSKYEITNKNLSLKMFNVLGISQGCYLKLESLSKEAYTNLFVKYWTLTHSNRVGVEMDSVLELLDNFTIGSTNLTSFVNQVLYHEKVVNDLTLCGVLFHDLNSIAKRSKEIIENNNK